MTSGVPFLSRVQRAVSAFWAALTGRVTRDALAAAEEEAAVAERRLREALDVLPEGIVFLDAEGRYILWNKRYAEIYERSSDLFREGVKLADTLRIGVGRGDYPQAVGREEAWLAERLALLDNPGQRHEQRLANGRWIMIEERKTADGGNIGLRVDITDMKRQSEALKEALMRAEAANRAKSEFLANVSHELRTPLNGIIGMAHVLSRTNLDDKQRQALEAVTTSAGNLAHLISDLLDFNSLEAGQVDVNLASANLAKVLRDAAEPFRDRAADKGLKLTLSMPPGEGGEVLADAWKISQVVTNLLSNAVKFTDTGQVTLSLYADHGEAGAVYRIAVADTGPGFDPADAARLFGQFEKTDGSITRAKGGIGLGLAISRHLADLMGGTLKAESEPGRGAVFTLALPLKPAPAAMRRPPQTGLKVLLADDNPTNRKVIELLLAAMEIAVRTVENGLEAVRAVGEEHFDVVLMDLQMPVMDGLTAIREIRKAEGETGRARAPVVVLSANVAAEDRAASMAAGADDHIGKPIQTDVLVAAIMGVLGVREETKAG
ncbi:MAG: response regulator [Caulobacteraceae bacterium]